MVRLKVVTDDPFDAANMRFNSTMVRLKERTKTPHCVEVVCFNSTMVRLKVFDPVLCELAYKVSIPQWSD